MSQEPSDPGQFQVVMEILANALERPAADRPRYLDEACADNAALRADVDSLLASASVPVLLDRPLSDFSLLGEATNSRQAPEVSLQPGEALAHYLIEEKLGEGGIGSVYKASDLKLGRTVALKVLRFTQASWQDRHRLALEARAASALNHPNIVTVYELGTEGDTDYIAMEYVDGHTLAALILFPEIPRETLLGYAREAAAGIAAAHQAGIIHRDLKPNNIMVARNGAVKVLDFGLARRGEPVSPGPAGQATISITALGFGPGSVMGTPAYMSPEQAVGAELDVRSDIFSFGVILYELACRKRPFQGATPQDTLHQVIVLEPPPAGKVDASVPPALASLIQNCLRKDKVRRPANMTLVATELARLSLPKVAGISRRMVGVSVLGGTAVALAGGLWFSGKRATVRSAAISIQAQQVVDGKPTGEPYIASVQDIFRAGWRFRLRVQSATPGFLYVINDGPGDNGKNRLWVLFPPTATQVPSATLETGWYVFDSTPGTEQLWLVWSSRFLPNLPPGQVAGPEEAEKIRTMLAQATTEAKPAANGTVTVQGPSDPLATRLELRHIG